MVATNEIRAVLGKESAFKTNNDLTDWQTNYSKQSFPFKPSDATIKHQIYDALLSLLQNKQIRHVKSGKVLPFALHESTVKVLRELLGFSDRYIKNIEASIFRDVENMRGYEIMIDAPFHLFKDLEKQDALDALFDIRAVAIPGKVLNALICVKLLETFSAGQLLKVPGFVLISSFDKAGNRSESVRLDIDAHLCRRGFMMPVLWNGLITNLKVFRHPNDERPFYLRSRKPNKRGQNKW